MLKLKNKKGFTLAELLIVVAIIAVLVAIAVPLFVGALNNAENGVKEANIRAVRGLAIASILSDSQFDLGKADMEWYATAQVDKKGSVTGLTIYKSTKSATAKPKAYTTAKTTAKASDDDFCYKAEETPDEYTVWVYIADTDVTKAATLGKDA